LYPFLQFRVFAEEVVGDCQPWQLQRLQTVCPIGSSMVASTLVIKP
jgi:hypothetical protein